MPLAPILSGKKRDEKQRGKEPSAAKGDDVREGRSHHLRSRSKMSKESALPGAEGSKMLSELIHPVLLRLLKGEFGNGNPARALWVPGCGPKVKLQQRLFRALKAEAYFYLDHDKEAMEKAVEKFPSPAA